MEACFTVFHMETHHGEKRSDDVGNDDGKGDWQDRGCQVHVWIVNWICVVLGVTDGKCQQACCTGNAELAHPDQEIPHNRNHSHSKGIADKQ